MIARFHKQKRSGPADPPKSAFTILELLASVALVMLLMLMVAQIMSNTRSVTSASRRRIDADAEARMIFDRMARDFSRMVKRPDVDYLIAKQTGNDGVFFYSEAPASNAGTGQNPVGLIGYRVNPSFQLERLGKGLTWDGAASDGVVFLTYASYPVTPASTPTVDSTLAGAFPNVLSASSTAANYHVIGQNVFRFEISFLLKPRQQADGSMLPAICSNNPWDVRPAWDAPSGHTSLNTIGLSDVQAVVVTLAILDETSRKILQAGKDLAAASAALPDPTTADLAGTPPMLPAKSWQAQIDSEGFAGKAGIPAVAANQVRIYQRTFPLNIP